MKKISKIGNYSLYLDKGKYYILRWQEDGRARSKSLGAVDLKAASDAAKDFARRHADPDLFIISDSGSDPTFGEIWAAYEQQKRARMEAGDQTSPRFRLLIYRLEKYFKPHLWRVRTSKLEPAMKRIDDEMRAAGLSPQTIDDVVRGARECWRLAFTTGRTRFGPSDRYKTPGFQVPRNRAPKGRYVGHEEIGKLISTVARGHIRDLLLIEVGTGARVGAIADLKKHQVDLALGVINFDEWSEAESNKGRPILPITGPLWEILERLVADAVPSGHLIHYRRQPIADGARNFFQTIRRLRTRAGIRVD